MADDGELAELRAQLGAMSPRWRQRLAAEQLAVVGTPEAAAALAEALVGGTDAQVVAIARRRLSELSDPAAIDAVCEVLIATGDQQLAALITEAGHIPPDLARRAVVWYLRGEFDHYTDLDFDGQLLAGVYPSAAAGLRARLVERARESGHIAWVGALGARQARRIEQLSNSEWEATLAALAAAGQHEQLWRLALHAPSNWGARMLAELGERGWWPAAATERAGYAELVALAGRAISMPAESLWTASSWPPTVLSHTGYVFSVAVSPDGGLLASGGNDWSVQLWRLPSGEPVHIPRGHTGWVRSVVVSPDGGLLASGSWDSTVRLWQLPSGRSLRTLTGHTGSVESVAVSPDGGLLASGSWDSTVRLWRLPSGEPVRTLTGHTGPVESVAVSPDGRLLASGSWDNTVRLWQLPSGQPVRTLTGHTDMVRSVAVSPDGALLASSSLDGTVRLWRLPSGEPMRTLTGHTAGVASVAVSPDGGLLASGSYDKTVRLWRLPSGEPVGTLTGHTDVVLSVAVGPDGGLLASGGYDKTVRLWSSSPAMCHTPVDQISLTEIEHLRSQIAAPAPEVLTWIELITTLVQWHRRHDIEVDTATVHPAATDVELDVG